MGVFYSVLKYLLFARLLFCDNNTRIYRDSSLNGDRVCCCWDNGFWA